MLETQRLVSIIIDQQGQVGSSPSHMNTDHDAAHIWSHLEVAADQFSPKLHCQDLLFTGTLLIARRPWKPFRLIINSEPQTSYLLL